MLPDPVQPGNNTNPGSDTHVKPDPIAEKKKAFTELVEVNGKTYKIKPTDKEALSNYEYVEALSTNGDFVRVAKDKPLELIYTKVVNAVDGKVYYVKPGILEYDIVNGITTEILEDGTVKTFHILGYKDIYNKTITSVDDHEYKVKPSVEYDRLNGTDADVFNGHTVTNGHIPGYKDIYTKEITSVDGKVYHTKPDVEYDEHHGNRYVEALVDGVVKTVNINGNVDIYTSLVTDPVNNKSYVIKPESVAEFKAMHTVKALSDDGSIVNVSRVNPDTVFSKEITDVEGNTYKVKPETTYDSLNGTDIEYWDPNTETVLSKHARGNAEIYTEEITDPKTNKVYKVKPTDKDNWENSVEVKALDENNTLVSITKPSEDSIYDTVVENYDKSYKIRAVDVDKFNSGKEVKGTVAGVVTKVRKLPEEAYFDTDVTDPISGEVHKVNSSFVNAFLAGETVYTKLNDVVAKRKKATAEEVYTETINAVDGNSYKVKPGTQYDRLNGVTTKVYTGTEIKEVEIPGLKHIYTKEVSTVDGHTYKVKPSVEYDNMNGNDGVEILEGSEVRTINLNGYLDIYTKDITTADGHSYKVKPEVEYDILTGANIEVLDGTEVKTLDIPGYDDIYTESVSDPIEKKTYLIKPTDKESFDNHRPINALVNGNVVEVTKTNPTDVYTKTIIAVDGKEYKVRPTVEYNELDGNTNVEYYDPKDGGIKTTDIIGKKELYTEVVEDEATGKTYKINPADKNKWDNHEEVKALDAQDAPVSVIKPTDAAVYTKTVTDFDTSYLIKPIDEEKFDRYEAVNALVNGSVQSITKRRPEEYYTETVTDSLTGKTYKVAPADKDAFERGEAVQGINGENVESIRKATLDEVYNKPVVGADGNTYKVKNDVVHDVYNGTDADVLSEGTVVNKHIPGYKDIYTEEVHDALNDATYKIKPSDRATWDTYAEIDALVGMALEKRTKTDPNNIYSATITDTEGHSYKVKNGTTFDPVEGLDNVEVLENGVVKTISIPGYRDIYTKTIHAVDGSDFLVKSTVEYDSLNGVDADVFNGTTVEHKHINGNKDIYTGELNAVDGKTYYVKPGTLYDRVNGSTVEALVDGVVKSIKVNGYADLYTETVTDPVTKATYKVKPESVSEFKSMNIVESLSPEGTIIMVNRVNPYRVYTEEISDVDGNTYHVKPGTTYDSLNGSTIEYWDSVQDAPVTKEVRGNVAIYTEEVTDPKTNKVYKIKPTDKESWGNSLEVKALDENNDVVNITKPNEDSVYDTTVVNYDKSYKIRAIDLDKFNSGKEVKGKVNGEVTKVKKLSDEEYFSAEVTDQISGEVYKVHPDKVDAFLAGETVYVKHGDTIEQKKKATAEEVYTEDLHAADGTTYKVKRGTVYDRVNGSVSVKVYDGNEIKEVDIPGLRHFYNKEVTTVDNKTYHVKPSFEYDNVNGNDDVEILDGSEVKTVNMNGYLDIYTRDLVAANGVTYKVKPDAEYNIVTGSSVEVLENNTEVKTVDIPGYDDIYTAEGIDALLNKTYKIKPTDVEAFNAYRPVSALVEGAIVSVTKTNPTNVYTKTIETVDGHTYKVKPEVSYDDINGNIDVEYYDFETNEIKTANLVGKKALYTESVTDELTGKTYKINPSDKAKWDNHEAINALNENNESVSITKPTHDAIYSAVVTDHDRTYHIKPEDVERFNNHETVPALVDGNVVEVTKRQPAEIFNTPVRDELSNDIYMIAASDVDKFNNYETIQGMSGFTLTVGEVRKKRPVEVLTKTIHSVDGNDYKVRPDIDYDETNGIDTFVLEGENAVNKHIPGNADIYTTRVVELFTNVAYHIKPTDLDKWKTTNDGIMALAKNGQLLTISNPAREEVVDFDTSYTIRTSDKEKWERYEIVPALISEEGSDTVRLEYKAKRRPEEYFTESVTDPLTGNVYKIAPTDVDAFNEGRIVPGIAPEGEVADFRKKRPDEVFTKDVVGANGNTYHVRPTAEYDAVNGSTLEVNNNGTVETVKIPGYIDVYTETVTNILTNKSYKINPADKNKWDNHEEVSALDDTNTLSTITKPTNAAIYTEEVTDFDTTYKINPSDKSAWEAYTEVDALVGNEVVKKTRRTNEQYYTSEVTDPLTGTTYYIAPADVERFKAGEEVDSRSGKAKLSKLSEIYTVEVHSNDGKTYHVKPTDVDKFNNHEAVNVLEDGVVKEVTNPTLESVYAKTITAVDGNTYKVKPDVTYDETSGVDADVLSESGVEHKHIPGNVDIYTSSVTEVFTNTTYKIKPVDLDKWRDTNDSITALNEHNEIVTIANPETDEVNDIDTVYTIRKSDLEKWNRYEEVPVLVEDDDTGEERLENRTKTRPETVFTETVTDPETGDVYRIKPKDVDKFNEGKQYVRGIRPDGLIGIFRKKPLDKIYTKDLIAVDGEVYKIKPTDEYDKVNGSTLKVYRNSAVETIKIPGYVDVYNITLTDIDGNTYKVSTMDMNKADGSGNTVSAFVDGKIVTKKLATYEEVYSEAVDFEGRQYRLRPTDVEAFHNYHAVNSYDPINKTITSVTKPDDEEIFTLEVHDFDETYHIRPSDETKWNNHEEIDVLTKDGVDQAYKRTNEQYYTETVVDNMIGKSYKVHADKVNDFNEYKEVDALDGTEVKKVTKTDPKTVYSYALEIGDTYVWAKPSDIEKYNNGEEIPVIKNSDLATAKITNIRRSAADVYIKEVAALDTATNGSLITVKAKPDETPISSILKDGEVVPASNLAYVFDRTVHENDFDTYKKVSKDNKTYLINIREADTASFNNNSNIVAFDITTSKYMLITSEYERVNPYLDPKLFTRSVYLDGKEVKIIPEDISDFISYLAVSYLNPETTQQITKLNVSEGQRALSLKITTTEEAKPANKDEDLDLKPDIKNLVSITTEKIVKLENASNPENPVEFARDRMLVKPEYNFMEFENVRDGLWIVLGERGTNKYELVGLSTNREDA